MEIRPTSAVSLFCMENKTRAHFALQIILQDAQGSFNKTQETKTVLL